LNKTVLADKSTVDEHFACYLFVFQAACTWSNKCYQQTLWADAVARVWWGG